MAWLLLAGRDLIYWVDKNAGIAFELYCNERKKQRLVRSIDVFEKGADYQPEGCVSPPQLWRELKRSGKSSSSKRKRSSHWNARQTRVQVIRAARLIGDYLTQKDREYLGSLNVARQA